MTWDEVAHGGPPPSLISSGTRSPRATQLRPRSSRVDPSLNGVAVVLLAALTIAGGLFFRPVFEAWGYLVPPVIGSICVALLVTWISHRFSMRPIDTVLLHVGAAWLTLPWLLDSPDTWFGIPTPRALWNLPDVVMNGPVRLLTSPLPARSGGPLVTAPVLSAWIGFIAGWVLLRKKGPGWAMWGPFVPVVAALAFGPTRGRLAIAITAGFVLVSLSYATGLSRMQRSGSTARSASVRGLIGATVLLVVITGVAGLAGSVSGFEERDRFSLRTFREPSFEPEQYPSPLALFPIYRRPPLRDQVLFRASGDLPVRWRLAVLPAYDGRVWSAGRTADGSKAVFDLIGARLPQPAGDSLTVGSAVRRSSQIELVELDAPWLPTPEGPINFSSPQPERDLARFNSASGTLALAAEERLGSRPVSYGLDWREQRVDFASVQGRALPFGPFSGSLPQTAGTAQIANAASKLVNGVTDPAAKVQKLVDFVQQGYWIEDNARPGHALGQLAPLTLGGTYLQGNDEQFAALFAVMARSLDIPVRVVVGFEPGDSGAKNEISGAQVRAWPEVLFGNVGWVPIDIEINKSKTPVRRESTALNLSEARAEQPQRNPQPSPPELRSETANPEDVDANEPVGSTPRSAQWWIAASALGVGLLWIASLLAAVVLRRRRSHARRSLGDRALSIASAWTELLERLSLRGIAVPSSASLVDVGSTVAATGARADLVNRLVEIGESAAFAPHQPSDAERSEAWRVCDELIRNLPKPARLQRLRLLLTPYFVRRPLV
jgi:transglutaminase-like putative cysteine protease